MQRSDGKIVVYYFHNEPKTERYIAATIWSFSFRGCVLLANQ